MSLFERITVGEIIEQFSPENIERGICYCTLHHLFIIILKSGILFQLSPKDVPDLLKKSFQF